MRPVLAFSVSLSRCLAADPEGAADLAPADTLLGEPLHLLIYGRRGVQPQVSESDELRGHQGWLSAASGLRSSDLVIRGGAGTSPRGARCARCNRR